MDNDMNNSEQKPCSFFMLFEFDNFTHELSIPPAVVRKYGSIFPENATIRINSGETLKVKLEQLDDMKYWFTNGWNTFTNDVGLEMGAFLVFWYIGHSIFDVSVFGISGCERVFSVHNNPTESDPDEFGND
ncbi:hypothetical protein ACJIZ3_010600 [Penstemon smallii]|uniref:TF-B3 domain-containing protein n=1 Tax=Penstemon smallii TaxID=265156 RepID=A0ABD3UKT6_9LAMI